MCFDANMQHGCLLPLLAVPGVCMGWNHTCIVNKSKTSQTIIDNAPGDITDGLTIVVVVTFVKLTSSKI